MNKDLEDKKRLERTKFLIHELKNNPKVTFCDTTLEQTNFPPRPVIKKDKEALEFIHRKKTRLSSLPCGEKVP